MLCRRIDIDVAFELPGRGIQAYDDFARRVLLNGAAAQEVVRGAGFPTDVEAFLSVLRRAHERLFADVLPDIAGRFRREGEESYFGGEGRHQRQGVPSDRIEADLRDLHGRTTAAKLAGAPRDVVVSRCAIFLQRFFAIHPFVDGNGRIGRYMIAALCESSGRYSLRAFETSQRWRRKYVKSLEFAHRYAPGSTDAEWRPIADPYRHLARWLDHHVEERPEGELVDEPP